MEARGKLKSYDKFHKEITFELFKDIPGDEADRLLKADVLDITAKKHYEKRSLSANGYMWIVLSKIAEKVRSSKDEVYEEMLQKYGYVYEDTVWVKLEVDMSNVPGHWRYTHNTDGEFREYQMIKGTSEYNRAEMAYFLDMVIEEAKALGIDTATPREIEKMLSMIGEKV